VYKTPCASTGNGNAAGMNKITGDAAAMVAQIPALFETLPACSFRNYFPSEIDRPLLERVSTLIRANLE
jgi:hypothetical protein